MTSLASNRQTVVEIELPLGGWTRLLRGCTGFTPHRVAGLAMVASLLWTSRKPRKDGLVLMRLTKDAARRFSQGGSRSSPATRVAKLWECRLEVKGQNLTGQTANCWRIPEWAAGRSETVEVLLTPSQRKRWGTRLAILRQCLEAANPHLATAHRNLRITRPGPGFADAMKGLKKPGEIEAAAKYLASPEKSGVSMDRDTHSNLARLPDALRATLIVGGRPVHEYDVQSAHICLLGMFYDDESGDEWAAERGRFNAQALNGFTFYGTGAERKKGKIKFLSALNQTTRVARSASDGYARFEKEFPLLAAYLARMKASYGRKAVGRKLRCAMAEIAAHLITANEADGIATTLVSDSAVVAMPDDLHGRHRAAFRTAARLGGAMAARSGCSVLIEGSDGANYRFFDSLEPMAARA